MEDFDDKLQMVSDFLLHNQFHLAALELRQELSDVSLNSASLDGFFQDESNAVQFVVDPADLQASPQLPKGMLPDFAPPFGPGSTLSALAARDERLAVLEYESRVASEKHAEQIQTLKDEQMMA